MPGYKPHGAQAELLVRALEIVQSVPYQVTARWLFYRLLQDGSYVDKESYKAKFLPVLSRARKEFYKGWRPDTLADDTREAVTRGDGWADKEGWFNAIGEAECTLDKWIGQPYYAEIWFEAKAMKSQFEYYTKYLTLRPFGGDPSIPYKWEIAKSLENAYEFYEVPLVILYFGDLDPKGLTIPESALRDIREWCGVPFEFIRCGLNPGDEKRYNIMENPDKPGSYQWEALSDEAAGVLITDQVSRFVEFDLFTENERLEQLYTNEFQEKWREYFGT